MGTYNFRLHFRDLLILYSFLNEIPTVSCARDTVQTQKMADINFEEFCPLLTGKKPQDLK